MLSENKNKQWGNERLWNRTAMISGIFAILISVLLIANYLQYKKADPVNMTFMTTLVSKLNENPADSTLREEIRTLDLLYRKAYFTSQWQIRTGGYFLLICVALFVISNQVIEYRRKLDPKLTSSNEDILSGQRRKARIWIVAGGGTILLLAIISAFLSSNDLGKKFTDLASGNVTVEQITAQAENTVSNIPETTQVEQEPATAVETTGEHAGTVAPAATGNDNYPNFRGNGGTGIVSKENIPEKWDGPSGNNILWKTAVPLQGYNSPVVWGNKVFLTGASAEKQEVYCFDRDKGSLVWKVNVGKGEKKPIVSDYTGFAPSTTVTDGKSVFAVFPTGDLIAIDFNGKTVWERDLGLPDNHYGHASSLLMADGKLILQYDQSTAPRIMALDPVTGKTVWSTDRQVKVSWSSPVLVNTGKRNEILVLAEPFLASYNPSNGQELWKIESVIGEIGPSPAYANGIAFVVNENSRFVAVKVGAQPKILWEQNELLSEIPSPVATDKYLFLATAYGIVACYDATTGQKYWEHNFENNIYASPIIIKDKVYILDFTGVMHIIKVDKTYQPVSDSPIGENCLSTPAFTNGRIYVRGVDNLYCIGK